MCVGEPLHTLHDTLDLLDRHNHLVVVNDPSFSSVISTVSYSLAGLQRHLLSVVWVQLIKLKECFAEGRPLSGITSGKNVGK